MKIRTISDISSINVSEDFVILTFQLALIGSGDLILKLKATLRSSLLEKPSGRIVHTDI